MATTDKLAKALEQPFGCPVYYIASTEAPLLREAAGRVIAALEAAGEIDLTRIDGPVPDMGEAIAAAGAISFFGTPRVVLLRDISPSTMTDKDVKELAALFGELENAVLIVTALYKDKKAAASKKAKTLLDAAAKIGFAQELAKPSRADTLRYIEQIAAELGAAFEQGAAAALLERAGDDRMLLRSETEKLAAVCGYRAIPLRAVERMTAPNIEADVFELSRLICSGRAAESFAKLNDLLALRQEPIAIAAALAGSYVDMLRVRTGQDSRKQIRDVFADMGYKGSDYRLKKAGESARRYSTAELEQCVLCLARLDMQLKSSAVADKGVLLQTAVGELLQIGRAR